MASFVEQATLKVNDQSTKQIQSINRALKELQRTARSMRSVKIDVGGIKSAQSQVRSLTRDLSTLSKRRANVRVNVTGLQQAQSQVRALNQALNSAARTRTARINARMGTGGFARGGGYVPPTPTNPNNFFWGTRGDSNWQAAGRIIARSFVAAVGFDLYGAVRAAGRSGREAVTTIDTARTNAAVGGIRDIAGFEAAAFRAADRTQGVSAGEIMKGTQEQVATLQAQLDKGAISLEHYNKSLEDVTLRVATSAQILNTIRGDTRMGAEDARQIERSLGLTSAGLNLQQQGAYATAVMNAIAASGGDITGGEVRRALQQFGSSLSQALSPEGLARLILARDEGGRQSTAEARMALQDAIRGNLSKADKERMMAAGLRDASGRTVFGERDFADPVGFALREILPRATKAGIDTSDSIAMQDFIDNALGFTQSGSRILATISTQAQQYRVELDRFRQTNAQVALDRPTLVTAFKEIETSFQDAIARSSDRWIPILKSGADVTSKFITKIGQGGIPTPGEAAGFAAVGFASSFAALADPATRPLATAGIGLQAAAVELSAAAVALGGAAAISGVGGTGVGKFAKSIPLIGGTFVASAAATDYVIDNYLRPYLAEKKIADPVTAPGKTSRLAPQPSAERFGGPMADPKQAIFALDAMLAGGLATMDNTFANGVEGIGMAFGAGGGQLLEMAPGIGAAIGSAAAAAINNQARVNVNVAPAAPNTGSMGIANQ